MKKILLSPFILIATLITALTSCDDSDNGTDIPTGTIFDMVTYADQAPEGAIFKLIRQQGDPEITLVAHRQQVNTSLFPIGCRMILAYIPENGNPNQSGNIKLVGGGLVTNGNATPTTAEETDNFDSESVRLTSVWLTGNYLNFEMLLDCTTKPLKLDLVIDEATMDTDNPVLYLIVKADDLGSAYWQQYYASYSLNDLMSTGAQQFTVVIKDLQSAQGELRKTFTLD